MYAGEALKSSASNPGSLHLCEASKANVEIRAHCPKVNNKIIADEVIFFSFHDRKEMVKIMAHCATQIENRIGKAKSKCKAMRMAYLAAKLIVWKQCEIIVPYIDKNRRCIKPVEKISYEIASFSTSKAACIITIWRVPALPNGRFREVSSGQVREIKSQIEWYRVMPSGESEPYSYESE